MGPSAEVHCAARAADRVQRSRNAFSSITMTKPGACRGTPLYAIEVEVTYCKVIVWGLTFFVLRAQGQAVVLPPSSVVLP